MNTQDIFSQRNAKTTHPLFIFEMANNHMGNVEHGLKIIRAFGEVIKKFPQFTFAFKFQYRDLDTFIHPDYQGRMDLKYVKRFSETKLSEAEFLTLKNEATQLGFITICTPFDEVSVDRVVAHGYDILKIASASSTDWPLLEKIVTTDKPLIASTGGTKLEDVDRLVSFFKHRQKTFAIMHCVGEYPTLASNLEMNQIDLFKDRFEDIVIGFSTHEEPGNTEPVKLAVAKGAGIFEKHVAIKSDEYEINAYSATPDQVEHWLTAAQQAFEMCGVVGRRKDFSEKELADIRQFQRGVFAKQDINAGENINTSNTFLAFPNKPGQLIANDLSKYTIFNASQHIKQNEPIISVPIVTVTAIDTRDRVWDIVQKSRRMLDDAKIYVTNQLDFEISHHYGIEKFDEFGAVIITCVNREYAKKLILVFPGQFHPSHMHKQKEETFHVLHGTLDFELNGEKRQAKAGEVIVVERGTKHTFASKDGAIFEEISSTHYKNDSYYDDENIMNNKNRKTALTYWVD